MVVSKSQEEELKMEELKVLVWMGRVKNEHGKFWRHKQSGRQKTRGSVNKRGLV